MIRSELPAFFSFIVATSCLLCLAVRKRSTQRGQALTGRSTPNSGKPCKGRCPPQSAWIDPEASTAGAKLFEQHCVGCHGTTAEGGKKGSSLLAGEVQQATPGALFWIITNGVVRRGMPVWSRLPNRNAGNWLAISSRWGHPSRPPAAPLPDEGPFCRLSPLRLSALALASNGRCYNKGFGLPCGMHSGPDRNTGNASDWSAAERATLPDKEKENMAGNGIVEVTDANFDQDVLEIG